MIRNPKTILNLIVREAQSSFTMKPRVSFSTKQFINNKTFRLVQGSSISHKVQYRFSNSQATLLEEVEGKVFQVLRSAAKCKQDKLSREATFEELGFDSLDSV